MSDRQDGGERVVLVHINFPAGLMAEDIGEFQELAVSAGAEVVGIVTGARRAPEPKYFVGKGKAEEIRDMVLASKVDLVIFNHVLSAGQERNLEQLLKCRLIIHTQTVLYDAGI